MKHNPTANSWSELAPMPTKRGGIAVLQVETEISMSLAGKHLPKLSIIMKGTIRCQISGLKKILCPVRVMITAAKYWK